MLKPTHGNIKPLLYKMETYKGQKKCLKSYKLQKKWISSYGIKLNKQIIQRLFRNPKTTLKT